MTQHDSTPATPLVEAPDRHCEDLAGFLERHHAAVVVLFGPRRGSELPLHRPRVVLGRATGADLVFQDDTVSREHAAISFADGSFLVEDLGSANGTLVNGVHVETMALRHGDRLRLGRLELQVLIEPRATAPDDTTVGADED